MPLPTSRTQAWPPPEWAEKHKAIQQAAVWYEGDPDKLAGHYAGVGTNNTDKGGFWARLRNRNTSQRAAPPQRLHLPAAADIATVSADLLFGETPTFLIPDAHNADQPGSEDEPTAAATEVRLNELVEEDGIVATLLEAAEYASALGGVYLRPMWDPALCERPLLTYVNADCAVPEFWQRQLVAVTFWTELVNNSTTGEVWRHLERYEMQGNESVVLHGLYKGTAGQLGTRAPLTDHSATAGIGVEPLAEGEDGFPERVVMPPGITTIAVRYVPNALSRKNRQDPVGRADTAGCEAEMDALDETYSALMRDVRLGKARITVPDEFLERQGRGQGTSFDVDQEVFSPLNVDPGHTDKAGIELMQPEIRSEQLLAVAEDLFVHVAMTAGYSPQSFGMQGDGSSVTATEVDARTGRSTDTTSRKRRYWQKPVDDVLEMLLIIDAEYFTDGLVPLRPRMEFAKQDEDLRELASSLNLLNLAGAVSIERKVRMLNPKWDDAEVGEEVARIKADMGSSPDPFGAGPGEPPEPGPPEPPPEGDRGAGQ